MAAPEGIDWDWALRTGGALSAHQKRQLLAPLVRVVLAYPAARLQLARTRTDGVTIDLDAIRWPDSSLAREAAAEAQETLPPYLLEHSIRTYLFGIMLAQVQQAKIDEEIVYVASMLHDTQLEHPSPESCFAVRGGEHAQQFVLNRDGGEAKAAAVGAAVAGHITVGALEDVSDPAGFVSAGAFADLTGVGLEHATTAWVDAVVGAHPRHQFRRQLLVAWHQEARTFPAGRARWLNLYAALPVLIKLAPFAE